MANYIFLAHSVLMRIYWLRQYERWARLLDQHAGWGNEARVAEALRHLDDALAEALR
jgi:hypothetical protein